MNRQPFLLSLTLPLLLCAMHAQKPADADTVAEIDGERITLQDLKNAAGERLARLEEQAYLLKQQQLEQMVQERLLTREARRRNMSLEALVDAEITSQAAEVTPQEIHSVYESNKNQLQKPESEVEGQIRTLLRERKVAVRRQEFAKALQSKTNVAVYLAPPPPFRAEVGMEGPARGPAGAPVTIVEFEDFQCPFCKQAQATLDLVLATYRDKVRMVHRDFPLQPLHPASWKSHEAARCAEEQGKFWQYRDLLYRNKPAAGLEVLSNYASQLGLNVADFSKCLDSGKFKAAVQKDEDEGERLGVQGTPAFFINGRLFSGAQPASAFARIIDEELSKRAQR
jgi:protein-disulfide isomerase